MHANLSNYQVEQPIYTNKVQASVTNILDIMNAQKMEIPVNMEVSEKAQKAKEKVIKQLSNMYKNTRMGKFAIQVNPHATQIEYKKIKGLMLNIEKRFSWYLDLPEGSVKCLLISIRARSAKDDLTPEDKARGFFEYYAKAILENTSSGGGKTFVIIPLYNLNIIVK
jgi:hypothetical protein